MIERLRSRPWHRNLVIFIAIVVVALYVEVAPRTIETVRMAQDLQVMRERYADALRAGPEILQIQARRDAIRSEVGELARFAELSDGQALLGLIQLAVTESRVQLIAIRPLPSTESANLSESRFEIDVEGGFHRQASLVNSLERLHPLVTFESIRLAADGLIPTAVTGRYVVRFIQMPRAS